MGIVRANEVPLELVQIFSQQHDCFLCGELIKESDNFVYWIGVTLVVILLHKYCASSLACHLISDFSRLNVNAK
jgi:hypothetical protein